MASSEYQPNFTKNQRQWNKFFWLSLSISTEENIFVKNDTSAILDGLATIAKRSTGKISIKLNYKTALALDFKGSTLLFDMIDPTILGIVEQESNALGLFEELKAPKKVGNLLDNKGFINKNKVSWNLNMQMLKGVINSTRAEDNF